MWTNLFPDIRQSKGEFIQSNVKWLAGFTATLYWLNKFEKHNYKLQIAGFANLWYPGKSSHMIDFAWIISHDWFHDWSHMIGSLIILMHNERDG